MKKILFIIMVISFGQAGVMAQKGFNIQVAGQAGLSFLLGDKFSMKSEGYTFSPIKTSLAFAYEAGLKGGYGITQNFGIGLGALYARQGQKYQEVNLYENNDITPYVLKNEVSLSYIKIPLTLHANSDPLKRVSFICEAGVYAEVLLSYKDSYSRTHGNYYYTQTMEGGKIRVAYGNQFTDYITKHELVGKPFKPINFGFTAGAGIQVKLIEKLYLLGTLNYEIGFKDVKNLECKYSPSTDPNREIVNRNSMTGFMLGLKKTF